jgi:hypothetical protein
VKKYKCHKEIHAEPMRANEWFGIVIGSLPEGIKGNDDGYHVIYSKGAHDEYHSWSPKKALDDGYTEIEENPPEIEEL